MFRATFRGRLSHFNQTLDRVVLAVVVVVRLLKLIRMSSRRKDEDFTPRLGVDYSKVVDRQVGDRRFEREKVGAPVITQKPASSTFDAFQRMAAGLDGRTLADKIADPNRPTWEQYKKENEDKLDMVSEDVRKMVQYREQLDQERERRLKQLGGSNRGPKDSDDESDSDDSDRHKSKKHRKESSKKSHKKHKKEKKSKKSSKKESRKRKRSDSNSSSSSSDSD